MKTVRVVAAIIKTLSTSGQTLFLATQRGYGAYKDGWEFPGGKIEGNETPQDALKREIQEELNMEIHVGEELMTVEYDYPEFHLSMKCFICTIASGKPHLLEHEAARWLPIDELDDVEWLPADVCVVNKLKESNAS